MREGGMNVIGHDDRFAPGTRDDVWIPEVSAAGMLILTKDRAIVRVGIEYDALLRAGARQFVLTHGAIPAAEIARAFLRARRAMEQRIRAILPPFVLSVSGAGNVARPSHRLQDGVAIAKGLRRLRGSRP
jgi:hypothetical protein